MEYDKDKVDDMVLAVLWLTAFEDEYGVRAWKGHDWEHLDRLHRKGHIGNPKRAAQSVVLTEAGRKRAEALFEQHFGTTGTPHA